MSFVGIVLVVIGFIVLIPNGALPGTTAARNMRPRPMLIKRNPGYRVTDEDRRKSRVYGIGTGLLMIVAGIVLLVVFT